jgi:protein TonB
MKKLIFALILSIFVHLLFLVTFKTKPTQLVSPHESKENSNTSSIKYVQLASKKKALPKKNEKAKKQENPTKEAEKKVVEKSDFKEVKEVQPKKPRPKVKEAKQTQPKPTSKAEALPNFVKKPPKKIQKTDLQKAQEQQQKESLTDFLMTPDVDAKMLDDLTQSYLNLYGKEYEEFTEVQKVFLKKNLKDIGYITQRYLRYPSLAVRLKQQGTNVVEFTLYPNGDIKHLRITNSSNSSSLDENTLETIQIAYKDYPRPKEPTKIRIYVNYFLY